MHVLRRVRVQILEFHRFTPLSMSLNPNFLRGLSDPALSKVSVALDERICKINYMLMCVNDSSWVT